MRSFALVLVAACAGHAPEVAAPASLPASQPAAPQLSLADVGLDASRMDRSADPCDDFYRFTCGAWLDKTEIPPDKYAYGTGNELADRNEAILHDILDKAAAAPASDPALSKLGAFYGACMDEAAIEGAGLAPMAPLFAATA